jgi:hypothetical protein
LSIGVGADRDGEPNVTFVGILSVTATLSSLDVRNIGEPLSGKAALVGGGEGEGEGEVLVSSSGEGDPSLAGDDSDASDDELIGYTNHLRHMPVIRLCCKNGCKDSQKRWQDRDGRKERAKHVPFSRKQMLLMPIVFYVMLEERIDATRVTILTVGNW